MNKATITALLMLLIGLLFFSSKVEGLVESYSDLRTEKDFGYDKLWDSLN